MSDEIRNWLKNGGWLTGVIQALVIAAMLFLLAKEKEVLASQYMPRIEYEGRHADLMANMKRIEAQQLIIIERQDELIKKVTETYTMLRIHMTPTP